MRNHKGSLAFYSNACDKIQWYTLNYYKKHPISGKKTRKDVITMSLEIFTVINKAISNMLWQCHGLNGNINITEGKSNIKVYF